RDERHHEPRSTSEIEQATLRRQKTIPENLQIDGIHPQFSPREFPRADSGREVPFGRAVDQLCDLSIAAGLPSGPIREHGAQGAEDQSADHAAKQNVDRKTFETNRLERRDAIKMSATNLAADFSFDRKQDGRDERVRDVRREIDLQAV